MTHWGGGGVTPSSIILLGTKLIFLVRRGATFLYEYLKIVARMWQLRYAVYTSRIHRTNEVGTQCSRHAVDMYLVYTPDMTHTSRLTYLKTRAYTRRTLFRICDVCVTYVFRKARFYRVSSTFRIYCVSATYVWRNSRINDKIMLRACYVRFAAVEFDLNIAV